MSRRDDLFYKKYIWEVRSLDVWGNEEDGWDVNDSYKIQEILLKEEFSDSELLKKLKESRCLRKTIRLSQIIIGGDDSSITVDEAKSGRPIFSLYRITHD